MPKRSSTDRVCKEITSNKRTTSSKRSSSVRAKSSSAKLPSSSFYSSKSSLKKVSIPKKREREEEDTGSDVIVSKVEAVEKSTKRPCTMDSRVETRRQEFYRAADWRPIGEQMFPTPVKDGPDSENDDVMPLVHMMTSSACVRRRGPGVLQEIPVNDSTGASVQHYQFRNIFTDTKCRESPLPQLSWADSNELWKSMVNKDSVYSRSSDYLLRHDDLQPRMRSILLDWIMEVCEVYSLHRETFYLSVDYIDRYLTNTKSIHKTRLQLVGVTALFIAAKLEEIYPPKLSEFAYVTDGACTEDEILSQELLMLSTLQWSLSPVTAISWLNVYLQTAHAAFAPGPTPSSAFFLPQYPQETFVHIAQLLDLCMLDLESLDFPTGVLAASALYHFSSRELATQVSGYQFKDIASCVHWMAPFAITVRDNGLQPLKEFRNVHTTDIHNIQTHANNIDTLDAAFENRSMVQTQLATCQSPTEGVGFMTPPKSGQKPTVQHQTSSLCSS